MRSIIKPLTSLRLFFMLMVLFSHSGKVSSFFLHPFFQEGYVGVGCFFILSGFIISYNYQERFELKQVDSCSFWVARLARIYPLHIVTFLLSFFLVSYSFDQWHVIRKMIAQVFLLQAFVPNEDYYFSFNGPSWSLCCEMLFYLLFPFFAIRITSLKRTVWLLICLVTCISVGMLLTSQEHAKAIWYVNPFVRLPDFIVGMLLYRLYRSTSCTWSFRRASFFEVGVILLFIGFYICGSLGLIPMVFRYSIYYWLPISLLLYVFSYSKGAVSKLLSWRGFVLGGDISFSAYLIHILVFKAWEKYDLLQNLNFILVLIFILVLSYFSYRYFERPANRFVKTVLK